MVMDVVSTKVINYIVRAWLGDVKKRKIIGCKTQLHINLKGSEVTSSHMLSRFKGDLKEQSDETSENISPA